MMPYKHTKFQVETHQGAGSVGRKVWRTLKIWKSLAPAGGGGGTGVGDHFGTFPPISVSIDRTSPKLLWWIAIVKLYKPTSFWVEPHRGAGSVKSGTRTRHLTKWVAMRNFESTCLTHAKAFPNEALGQALARTRAEQGHKATGPHDHRAK